MNLVRLKSQLRVPISVESFGDGQAKLQVVPSIGPSTTQLKQQLTVLDTGAVGNFIRTTALPLNQQSQIQQRPETNSQDANQLPLRIQGFIRICV